jgi:hypothetical protein
VQRLHVYGFHVHINLTSEEPAGTLITNGDGKVELLLVLASVLMPLTGAREATR